MNYIEELQGVIKRLHGSDSTHVESVPIKEVFNGETVWEGQVEVFDLHDHPKTDRVYAWAHDTDDARNGDQWHLLSVHWFLIRRAPVCAPGRRRNLGCDRSRRLGAVLGVRDRTRGSPIHRDRTHNSDMSWISADDFFD